MAYPQISPPQTYPQYDWDLGRNGISGLTGESATAGSSLVAGGSIMRCIRVFPSRNMTIVKIGFVTTVAATNNDNIDVAIYDQTGARLVSSGATAGKANAVAGRQTITIAATTLSAKTPYYLALCYGTVGGTAATFATVTYTSALAAQMWGTDLGYAPLHVVSSVTTCPTTISAPLAQSSLAYDLIALES